MDVLCYSSDLVLLWRKTLPFESDHLNQPIKALSVLVTSFTQHDGDIGSIYVGASFSSAKDERYGCVCIPHVCDYDFVI